VALSPAELAVVQMFDDWHVNPRQFYWENFKVDLEPWARRANAAYAVSGKRRVGMQAAVGVGKSFMEACFGWHFLATNGNRLKHEGKYPVGYALSISGDNLKSGLWKELGVLYERSPFLQREFKYTAEQIVHRKHSGWWLRARSFRQTADPEAQGAALSGLHGPWVQILLDEIGTMHPQIGRRAEQIMSDVNIEQGFIAGAGNPTSTTGLLYDIATAASGWSVVRITGDPDDPECSQRIDKAWAREQIKRWGRDNPWVMSHILGKFPPGGLNTLLSADEVNDAMENRKPAPDQWTWAQKRIGIDVARFGDDRTVLFPRQGLVAFRPAIMRNADTMAIAARALNMISKWGSEAEFIDDTGHWGHGVVDALRAARRNTRAVIFSDPDIEPQYYNRRAGNAFRLTEWVRRGGSLPNLPEMKPELTQVQYGYKDGKMILEDKDQIKKRLGFSTDLLDALALTFSEPDVPSAALLEASHRPRSAQAVEEYDPFAEFK
jgi:phage terminase large subunit